MKKLYLVFIFCLPSFLFAQAIQKQIEPIVQDHVHNRQFSGTVLVADLGKVVYQDAFGTTNVVLICLLESQQSIVILSNNDAFDPDSFGDENNLREALIRVLATQEPEK